MAIISHFMDTIERFMATIDCFIGAITRFIDTIELFMASVERFMRSLLRFMGSDNKTALIITIHIIPACSISGSNLYVNLLIHQNESIPFIFFNLNKWLRILYTSVKILMRLP